VQEDLRGDVHDVVVVDIDALEPLQRTQGRREGPQRVPGCVELLERAAFAELRREGRELILRETREGAVMGNIEGLIMG